MLTVHIKIKNHFFIIILFNVFTVHMYMYKLKINLLLFLLLFNMFTVHKHIKNQLNINQFAANCSLHLTL